MVVSAAMRLLSSIVLVGVSAGCASTTAEAPLTISLGLGREATTTALHDHQYCHKVDPPQKIETYPRCNRVGSEWGESWVTAAFENDKVVEIRRWERFTEDSHAVERWNQLVLERNKIVPESEGALAVLRTQGLLQPGTRAVKAFQIDPTTVVAVYLLAPSPPEEASVLEKIVLVGGAK